MRDNTMLENITLPDSVLEALAALGPRDGSGSELNEKQLDALNTTFVETRKKHRDYRTQSGIEAIWQRCQDSYDGMDDANRHEFAQTRVQVPPVLDGPLVFSTSRRQLDTRSTLFPRMTSRYVDMGQAKAIEILLPPDERHFSYEPTPVPSLIDYAESEKPVLMPDGSAAERDAKPDELTSQPTPVPSPPDPANPTAVPQTPGVPILERDLAAEQMEIARKKAKKAETRVHDWHVEAQYPAKLRRVVGDSALFGVGIMKGPFPTMRKAMAIVRTPDPVTGKETVTLSFEEKLAPDYKVVSPWDLFPSPSCGENVREGGGLFERDRITRTQVEDLADLPGYIQRAIAQVLHEGPQKHNLENANPSQQVKEGLYEVWYFYGSLSYDEWDAIKRNQDPHDVEPRTPRLKPEKSVHVVVTMINDCIVYAAENPLQSGEIPFYTFPWKIRRNSWAGVGVAEEISMPQRMVTATTRALLENAGKSAGAQIVMDDSAIYPDDGLNTITRDKLWKKKPECDDVRKAFAIFQIPNVGDQLLKLKDYGFQLGEESCNIPLISQGQSGVTTPDTFGAAKLQNNNANQLLRSIAATVDDHLFEPQARSDYEWLMLDPDVPADEKGDFQINAHGSSTLVERAIQDQAAVAQLELVLKGGEMFGVDPKKAYAQALKAQRLNPADWQYSKEDLEQKAKQPPAKDTALQVAEIRAQVDMERTKTDTDRDRAYVQAETERTQSEHTARMQELELKRELELLRYANEQKISLMQVKSDLAQTSMKLAVQKQLSGIADNIQTDKPTPEMTAPPSEPQGTAPVGESWQR